MTISHGADFSIDMTDRSLHADYLTSGNETRLLVINPETDELFNYIGDFEITEIIVANTQYEVSVELPIATTISLSDAYPNPFNPAATIAFSLKSPASVSIDIFNSRGRLVDSMYLGNRSPGNHLATWDGSNFHSGLYVFLVRSNLGAVYLAGTMLK